MRTVLVFQRAELVLEHAAVLFQARVNRPVATGAEASPVAWTDATRQRHAKITHGVSSVPSMSDVGAGLTLSYGE